MRRLFLFVIFFWQSCFFVASAEATERIALIFGNGDYQNAPRLPNPVSDATDVAAAFGRLGFSVLLIKNGTFDAMRRALVDYMDFGGARSVEWAAALNREKRLIGTRPRSVA